MPIALAAWRQLPWWCSPVARARPPPSTTTDALTTTGTMTTGTMTTGTMTTAPVNPALQAIDPARLHDVVQKLIDQMRVPGAVVQLRTPQGNFTVAVGTTDLDTQTPPAADTHFRIASNTKTLTAALIMLLAQDGKLRLTDPVSTTYQMCPMAPTSPSPSCSMRSGLSNYTADSEFAATLDTDPPRTGHLTRGWRSPSGTRRSSRPARSTTTTTPTTRCWVWLPRRPVAANWPTSSRIGCSAQWVCTSRRCRRGRCWRHSGAVLARIHVRRNVLRARRRSLSRRPPGGGPVWELRPVDYTQQNSSYATAAGGAISTADDLATWIRALVSGQVFDADVQKQWLASPQAEDPARPTAEVWLRNFVSAVRSARGDVLPRRGNARLQLSSVTTRTTM
jgi:D-alanyl-D-alanine carboxypeptidase